MTVKNISVINVPQETDPVSSNRLFVDEIPSELKCLEKLAQILIAQQLLFQKIVIMPKGQIRKIKLAICNVPVDCDQTCNVCQDHLKGQVKSC